MRPFMPPQHSPKEINFEAKKAIKTPKTSNQSGYSNLQLQSLIGNRTMQRLVTEELEAGSKKPYSSYSSLPYMAPASASAAPSVSGGAYGSLPYMVPSSASAAPSAFGGAYGSLPYMAPSSASAAPSASGGAYGSLPVTAPAFASAAPVADTAPSKYNKKSMDADMLDFDTQVQPAGTAHSELASTTFYADTAEKKQPFTRSFVGGKMVDSAGKALDTIGSEQSPTIGSKADRHIYTMDGDGGFASADAIKEIRTRTQAAKAAGKTQQERFHHSSFNAGKAVAGAGELQVRAGQVELFNDNSGHYEPGSEQMLQTAAELEAQKAGIEGISAEFVGKRPGQAMLKTSALEILGYQQGEGGEKGFKGGAASIETEIRKAHGKKDAVMEELLAKTKKTQRKLRRFIKITQDTPTSISRG